MLGYSAGQVRLPVDMVKMADQMGVWAVWTAEAYGSDAVTPLAWLGAQTQNIKLGTAIMQMPGRTPANTAMTAMTLNQLSGGRFLLGLGLSGPQVVEGWHGQSYSKPLRRTREYVEIVRRIFRREEKLSFEGEIYQIPYAKEPRTGLGKPLRSTLEAQPDIPIYLAALGPKNVSLTAEIADGWLPIFFSPERFDEIYRPHLEAGFEKAGGKSMKDFDIAPTVTAIVGDDLEACYDKVRPQMALYIGGMGAKGKNFYNDLARRYGYEEVAEKVQDLYLAGKKAEAIAAIPGRMVDEVALIGPPARIRERLQLWTRAPITTLNLAVYDPNFLKVVAEALMSACG